MIKIEVIKAYKSSNKIDLTTPVANIAAAEIGDLLNKHVSKYKCKIHPESAGKITVISTPNNSPMYEINKSNFCCEEFENSIDIKLK
jgi:hypothetical protein